MKARIHHKAKIQLPEEEFDPDQIVVPWGLPVVLFGYFAVFLFTCKFEATAGSLALALLLGTFFRPLALEQFPGARRRRHGVSD